MIGRSLLRGSRLALIFKGLRRGVQRLQDVRRSGSRLALIFKGLRRGVQRLQDVRRSGSRLALIFKGLRLVRGFILLSVVLDLP